MRAHEFMTLQENAQKPLRIPLNLPQELRDEIAGWPIVSQSPFSDSFYNVPSGEKTWTHTPEGSLRISDHWNFPARDMLNCPTDVPVRNGWWSLGRWENDHYKILTSIPKRPLADYSDEEAKHLNLGKQERRIRSLQHREYIARKFAQSEDHSA
jgi:hypothetical protein